MSASNKSFNVGLLLGMWLLVNVIVATPLTAKSNSIDEQQHGSVQRDRLTSVPMSITQRNNNNNNNITMHALLAQPSEQHGSLEKDESNDLAALLSGNNGQKLGKLASLGGWHGNSLLPLLLLSGNHLLGKLDPLSLLLLTSGKSNTLTSVLLLQHLRKQGVAIGPLHTIALLGGLGKFGGHGLFGAHAFGPFGGIGHLNPLLLLLLASSHKADHPDRILPDQLLKSAPKEWADILHGAVPPPPALPSSYKYPEFVSLPDNSWADKLPSAFEYDGKSSDLASSYDHFWTSPMSTSAPPASRSKTIASKSPNKSKQKF